jgi:hypothetical protein
VRFRPGLFCCRNNPAALMFPLGHQRRSAMEKTSAAELAEHYLRLGGGRLAKIDDNHVTTREWQHETPAAEAFWNEQIASLDEKRRDEVITLLPTINEV